MNVRRVRQIGFNELACRSRQAASKWLDRTSCSRRSAPRVGELLGLDRFRAVGPDRFFAGATGGFAPRAISDRMPAVRADLLAEGEALLAGRFDLLGYRGLDFGHPIDWHLDPVSGRRAPETHWSRLNPLAFTQVGDSKVIWELNRHQWLVRLGQAYQLTGDKRYAEAVAGHLSDWVRNNPTGIGINWASSLEVSYRVIAWCWCLFLLDGSPALTPALFSVILEGIWMHARHIERYLSYYFSPNTHLTGEALGLFYVGQIFRELPDALRWAGLGARILTEECERQILSDGVYFERATGYQRYTLEIYLHFLALASRNSLPIPAAVAERTERMADFVVTVRLPDGSVPQIGDADSGTLVPFERRGQGDFRGVLATAAAMFRRGDCAWAAGGAASDLLWLLGPEGLVSIDALCPAPPATPSSRVFPEGGYAVMRSDWRPDGQMLIFDAGPLGSGSAGHGHADLLSVQCAVFGEPFLIDAGTYRYTGDPVARAFFRGTAAHSTIMVDGEPHSEPTGPFQWSEHPSASLRDWCSTPELVFADAEHRAYYPRMASVHRRRVVYVRDRYWVIVDDVTGAGQHEVDLRFQFAPLDVELDGETVWARSGTGHGLMLRPFSAQPVTARVHRGELNPMQGWISPEYGHRQKAPLVSFTWRQALPLRVATLMAPLRATERAPLVSAVLGRSLEPIGLAFRATAEQVIFGDGGIPSLSSHVRHRGHRRG